MGKRGTLPPAVQTCRDQCQFYPPLEDGVLQVRTYERGVEDETMACGTGAVASAIIAALLGKVVSPVQVLTSGGEPLRVVFDLKKERCRMSFCRVRPDAFMKGN